LSTYRHPPLPSVRLVPLAEIRVWQPVDPVRVLALAELMIAGAEFAPVQLDANGRLCNGDERLAAARAAGFSHVPTVTRALVSVERRRAERVSRPSASPRARAGHS
jgi:hypothetical protein